MNLRLSSRGMGVGIPCHDGRTSGIDTQELVCNKSYLTLTMYTISCVMECQDQLDKPGNEYHDSSNSLLFLHVLSENQSVIAV
jgi:hypothetical protein